VTDDDRNAEAIRRYFEDDPDALPAKFHKDPAKLVEGYLSLEKEYSRSRQELVAAYAELSLAEREIQELRQALGALVGERSTLTAQAKRLAATIEPKRSFLQ
jgi:hypothetical protein